MNRNLTIVSATALSLMLAACETPPSKESVGGVTGAVVGGVIGHQIGEGRGKDLATVAGFILGAVLGSNIGRSLAREDERRAQMVLEENRTGHPSHWVNPDSGADVTMVPTHTYQSSSGEYCREYQTTVVVGGKTEKAYGTACRQPDGSWRIVN